MTGLRSSTFISILKNEANSSLTSHFSGDSDSSFSYGRASTRRLKSFKSGRASASSLCFRSSSFLFSAVSFRVSAVAFADRLGCRSFVRCSGQFGKMVGIASGFKYRLSSFCPFLFRLPRALDELLSVTKSSATKCLLQSPILSVIFHSPSRCIFPFHSFRNACIEIPVMSTFL